MSQLALPFQASTLDWLTWESRESAITKYKNATNFFINIFTSLRRPKLQPKVWIKLSELNKFLNVVIWLTFSQSCGNELKTLMLHIKRLVKRSGWNFTFLYLKESLRLIIRFMSGSPEPIYHKGIIVSRDYHGLPRILPINLRNLLLDWENNIPITRSVLTLISIFRVFPTTVKPKLDTITQPFTGMGKTLSNLDSAVWEVFGRSGIQLISPKLIKLETAGPNAVKSAWGSSLDALAFIHYPKEYYNFFRYCLKSKALLFFVWSLWLILIGGIPYLLLLAFKKIRPLRLGKLGVVYDQAGKARVIAICSYWLQLVLKPLHNSLFRILHRIKSDGTFDQHKPLQLLIEESDGSQKFSCFDLSAATDRLPIELQRDILNIASRSNLGDLWSSLLAIDWYYKNAPVRYSVGQPMGAYSSWGMLAITHHVIVRYAALRCGIRNFGSYAVLGDDIVIMHDRVAENYLQIMQNLGVAINLNKSIVSSKFAEFAKVWRGPNIDVTPIGPGLILRSVRNDIYKGVLLGEAQKLGLITSLSQLLTLIKDLKNPFLALWSTLGLGSDKWRNQTDADAIVWGLSSTPNPRLFLYCLMNSVKQISIDDWKESKLKNQKEEEFFYRNWWRVYSSSNWPSRVLEALLKLIGPGFWIYAFSFLETDEKLGTSPPIHAYVLKDLSSIRDMVNSDPLLSLSSIDWTEKKKIDAYGIKAGRIASEFERTRDEMEGFDEML